MVIGLIRNKEIWDIFVDQSPYGSLFHKWNFLTIMEKQTGCKLLPYGIYKGDKLICIFPVFFKKYKGLKMVFSPPPQTGVNSLGFVMSQEFVSLRQNKKETYLNIVVEDFNKEIEKISPNFLSITLVPNFLDVRSFEWNNYNIDIGFTYTINLNSSLDKIWNGFDKDLRNEIKKADLLNLKLLKSDDVSMFYESAKTRYEEQGLNFALSKNYLEELLKTYKEYFGLYYLYDSNGNIVSNQINFKYKDTFMVWMGGMKTQIKTYGNEYMIWESIKKAKNIGCEKFDWGGGTKTISQFKSQFNPILRVFFIIHKEDNFAKFAEWTYQNCMKRMGIFLDIKK